MAEVPETIGCDGEVAPEGRSLPAPARFAMLYESRDGRLCLFEDAEGHLTSVDAQRLC